MSFLLFMKENNDKTLRLIVGVILVLISLPILGMMSFGGAGMMGGYRMMGNVFGLGIFLLLAVLGIFILGLYLIFEGLKNNKK